MAAGDSGLPLGGVPGLDRRTRVLPEGMWWSGETRQLTAPGAVLRPVSPAGPRGSPCSIRHRAASPRLARSPEAARSSAGAHRWITEQSLWNGRAAAGAGSSQRARPESDRSERERRGERPPRRGRRRRAGLPTGILSTGPEDHVADGHRHRGRCDMQDVKREPLRQLHVARKRACGRPGWPRTGASPSGALSDT